MKQYCYSLDASQLQFSDNSLWDCHANIILPRWNWQESRNRPVPRLLTGLQYSLTWTRTGSSWSRVGSWSLWINNKGLFSLSLSNTTRHQTSGHVDKLILYCICVYIVWYITLYVCVCIMYQYVQLNLKKRFGFRGACSFVVVNTGITSHHHVIKWVLNGTLFTI